MQQEECWQAILVFDQGDHKSSDVWATKREIYAWLCGILEAWGDQVMTISLQHNGKATQIWPFPDASGTTGPRLDLHISDLQQALRPTIRMDPSSEGRFEPLTARQSEERDAILSQLEQLMDIYGRKK